MREGLVGDDLWIMVEDEFMMTAREFTRHLHQAEYDRLKRLAKEQNASTASDLGRSERSQGLSNQAKFRKRSEVLADKQKALLEPFASEEDSDDDLWSQNPQLAGLMSHDRRSSSKLSQIAIIKSNTRASLGFSQVQKQSRVSSRDVAYTSKVDSSDHSADREDVLDKMSSSHLMTNAPTVKRSPGVPQAYELEFSEHRLKSGKHKAKSSETDEALPATDQLSFAERTAKRRVDPVKIKKREENAISMDQVPTFLI